MQICPLRLTCAGRGLIMNFVIEILASDGESTMQQREGQFRNPSGCAVVGVIDRSGKKMTGSSMIEAIEVMHDRSNGLGGGFAGYGIYPHYKDFYAFHLFFDTQRAQEETEAFLKKHFEMLM